MPTTISQRPITDAVLARARTLSALTQSTYEGELPQDPPKLPADEEGRVAAYAVIYPFGPTPGPEVDLGDVGVDLVYTFQATLVAGYRTDLEWLVDRFNALFFRWTPAVDGLACGPFKPPVGYQPGPIRRNDQVRPPRFRLPLQYRTTVTPATP